MAVAPSFLWWDEGLHVPVLLVGCTGTKRGISHWQTAGASAKQPLISAGGWWLVAGRGDRGSFQFGTRSNLGRLGNECRR